MKCEKCKSFNSDVRDSRKEKNGLVRRRRVCKNCGWRWSTIEINLSEYQTMTKSRRDLVTRMVKNLLGAVDG